MDAIDRAIITQLQSDGRLTNVELAARVGLSPSPCLRRIRQLEASGVITGYHATIDPDTIGRGFQVLVHITMAHQEQATISAFEEQVSALEEVVECRRMFGNPDFLVWVAVPDLAAYESLYINKLVSLPGVARVTSQFTMKVVKEHQAPPLAKNTRTDK
ncbi:putative transcriptional regulator, AsnC family protein [Longimycelium tulufanense]|uniref:Putative transcriptional regulator, AsnC family protein n=1 Tax=Longimycelium tulufanense TaxID=907463 RepID=A0A8J3CF76_9PSEU|nr:Lrp/AsnC family transcriptional regulator [Longimycelium tulufanense]GGM57709.1 putative transcriptional regulator, AsnC family protein [Longimycelium tulufanense]